MFDVDMLSVLFSQAVQSSIAEKLFVAGVIWHFVSKKFSKHFASVESTLIELKNAIVEMKETHSDRLDHLEGRVDKIERIY